MTGGVCNLNNGGVDRTFIEIPRGTVVKGWTPFISSEEQLQKNVRLGRRTISVVHTYE